MIHRFPGVTPALPNQAAGGCVWESCFYFVLFCLLSPEDFDAVDLDQISQNGALGIPTITVNIIFRSGSKAVVTKELKALRSYSPDVIWGRFVIHGEPEM